MACNDENPRQTCIAEMPDDTVRGLMARAASPINTLDQEPLSEFSRRDRRHPNATAILHLTCTKAYRFPYRGHFVQLISTPFPV